MFLLIGWLLHLLQILIFARCILSFAPAWQRQPWGRIIIALTEPILRPLRSVVRIGGSGVALDFSPMIALFIISVLSRAIGR
jgi:uncharacterized protein YggT (Ycf19 family)